MSLDEVLVRYDEDGHAFLHAGDLMTYFNEQARLYGSNRQGKVSQACFAMEKLVQERLFAASVMVS